MIIVSPPAARLALRTMPLQVVVLKQLHAWFSAEVLMSWATEVTAVSIRGPPQLDITPTTLQRTIINTGL